MGILLCSNLRRHQVGWRSLGSHTYDIEVSKIVTLLDANAKYACTKYQIHAPEPKYIFPKYLL